MKLRNITRHYRVLALAGVAVIALPLAFGNLATTEQANAGLLSPASVQLETAAGYRAIVEADKPAVVTIITKGTESDQMSSMRGQGDGPDTPFDEFFRRFFNDRGMPTPDFRGQKGPHRQKVGGLGSGFIISADGTIVTNNHVVDNAEEIKVILDDGSEHIATLVGRDAKTDLAVIRIKTDEKLPTIAWGDSEKVQAGDPILAIGNPFGIGTTVTAGIVSARGRDLHNGPYDDFIQVDAAINHGNSGGPLIDMEGHVVGINTAIYSPNGGNVGVGFAIPSDQAQKIVARLIEHGSIEHGYIGVMIQPVTKDVAEAIGLDDAKGALIANVEDGTPAAKAGLKPGDVVTSFGSTEIDNPKALSRAVADLDPGTKSTINVVRKGKPMELSITVGKLADQVASNETDGNGGEAEPGAYKVPDLGITLSNLSDQDRESADIPEETEGAVVASVEENSSAADELREGDIILSVNQEPVSGASDAGKIIESAKKAGKNSVLLLVERGQAQSFVAVPFARG